jgi:hypothetical protein
VDVGGRYGGYFLLGHVGFDLDAFATARATAVVSSLADLVLPLRARKYGR